ncbi:MAG: GNAT family N-acetyltransferase [Chryseosolibacter sp.]
METALEILEYQPAHQPWFEQFNRQWIEKYFTMEPLDFQILQNPEQHIIEKGGSVFMASWQGILAGTVALKFVTPEIYELTKMAVDENFQGRSIGRALAAAAIARARRNGAKKVFLYSNTMLGPAINLYTKLGFTEIPVDGPYKRSNIKMELNLS